MYWSVAHSDGRQPILHVIVTAPGQKPDRTSRKNSRQWSMIIFQRKSNNIWNSQADSIDICLKVLWGSFWVLYFSYTCDSVFYFSVLPVLTPAKSTQFNTAQIANKSNWMTSVMFVKREIMERLWKEKLSSQWSLSLSCTIDQEDFRAQDNVDMFLPHSFSTTNFNIEMSSISSLNL